MISSVAGHKCRFTRPAPLNSYHFAGEVPSLKQKKVEGKTFQIRKNTNYSNEYLDELSETREVLDNHTIFVKRDAQIFTNVFSIIPPLRYVIQNDQREVFLIITNSQDIGVIEEQDSFLSFIIRHLLRKRRPSTLHVENLHGKRILTVPNATKTLI
jgi:hypothetical protein